MHAAFKAPRIATASTQAPAARATHFFFSPPLPLAFFFAFFAFFAGFDFGHPVTLTGCSGGFRRRSGRRTRSASRGSRAGSVLTLRVSVCLWPLILTVTFFLTVVVFVREQRLPLAARAEYLPSGSVSSKLVTGWSGTVLNVLLVIPALLMNVLPVRTIFTP